jgi:hypothetical protein
MNCQYRQISLETVRKKTVSHKLLSVYTLSFSHHHCKPEIATHSTNRKHEMPKEIV